MEDINRVSDIDVDIAERKKIIEEAKQIDSSKGWNEISKEVSSLQRKWRRLERWESSYEEELEEEFHTIIDGLYAIRNAALNENKKVKEALIQEANEVLKETNFKNATNAMNDLMNRWKATPSAGKETDDALWDSFNTIRQKFFDAKNAFFEKRQEDVKEAIKIKNEIVEKAESIKNSEEFTATSNEFNELMTKWKNTVFTTKEEEDALWAKFNGARQTFYEARNAFYEKRNAANEEKYTAKKALVDEVNAIVTAKAFTRENTENVKATQAKWKEIGNCGKEKETEIYHAFKEACDNYFSGLKAQNEEKHAQWLQGMQDARDRKLDLIQKQEKRIQYLQRRKTEVLAESAEQEIQEDIEDTQDFLEELKVQLQEIEDKLK